MSDETTNQNGNPIHALSPLETVAELERLLAEHRAHRDALPAAADPVDRARVTLDIAEALLGLGRNAAAWNEARPAFDVLVAHDAWQEAAEAADILYRSEQDKSLVALANGVWLAVTWPIDPDTTVALLQHIVEETPDDSDGGAVAAAAAHYLADIRTQGERHESLTFFTAQLLAQVARRHRGIEDPEQLDIWMEVLELNDPGKFLPRLAQVLDVIADGDWWYDRDAIRARLPVN